MPPAPTLPSAPSKPKADALQPSYLILKYSHDSAESLLKVFNDTRVGRGTPTDEQQDLLRAMLVFAGAGLDSMTKQLVRDALPLMVEGLPERRREMEKFVVRHLRRTVDAEDGSDDADLNPQRLAKILLADSPRVGIAEMLVNDLTSGSLQSADELFKVVAYLGVAANSVGATKASLKEVFDCRNRIIHEMDIDFQQPNRNRFPRKRDEMVRHAKTLLEVGTAILADVDKTVVRLRPPSRRPRAAGTIPAVAAPAARAGKTQ